MKTFLKNISTFKSHKYFLNKLKIYKLYLNFYFISFKKFNFRIKSHKLMPFKVYNFAVKKIISFLRHKLLKKNSNKKKRFSKFIKLLKIKFKYSFSKKKKSKLKKYYFRFLKGNIKRRKIYSKKLISFLLKCLFFKKRILTKFLRKQRSFLKNRFVYFFKTFNNFLLKNFTIFILRKKFKKRKLISNNLKNLATSDFSLFLTSNRAYSNIVYNFKTIKFL
jgi:hypothetical protein